MSARQSPTQAHQYELEVAIDAPRAGVWQALTEQVESWWPGDFSALGPGSVMTFEARAGGHLQEQVDGGKGGSLLWYTVTMCVPQETLHLVGHIAPPWGGPAMSLLHLALEDKDGGTLLRISDSLVGASEASTAESQEMGWMQIFRDGLKAHVEAN